MQESSPLGARNRRELEKEKKSTQGPGEFENLRMRVREEMGKMQEGKSGGFV